MPSVPFHAEVDTVHEAAAGGTCTRPTWSGLLRLSLITIPLKAYPAHPSSPAMAFHQLHAGCGQRIQHQKRCPVHGAVETAQIVKGYPYAHGQYAVVEAEELNRLRPAKDKALVLERFVGSPQVDPLLFAGRSLYLVPDGVAAAHPYALVAHALEQAGRWALGHVVLTVQRQLVLVRPRGGRLLLDVLRYPAEVRALPPYQRPDRSVAFSQEELQWTLALIEARSRPLDWSTLRDVNREELAALIEAKVAGQPRAPAAAESAAALHLLDALKQSVAAARRSATGPSKVRKTISARRAVR